MPRWQIGVRSVRNNVPQPKSDYLHETYRVEAQSKQAELGIYVGDRDQLLVAIRDHDLADRGLLPACVSYEVPVRGFGVIVAVGQKAALFPKGYMHADPIGAATLFALRQVDGHLQFLPDDVRGKMTLQR